MTQAASGLAAETLDSWKAIASHLRRDVRTVMRWERVRGLPVHRVPGGGKPGVYALKSELEAWLGGTRLHSVEPGRSGAAQAFMPCVAVLPFTNLSAERANEYFSDGLADEIITALTRIPGLRVTARTSSFAFRQKQTDVREIGAALGVGSLLEGSVQRSGCRIRISAQLVDVASGFHLWSEHYDRDVGDAFAIQDEISHAVAGALHVRLVPLPTARRTTNLLAYHEWLRGRHLQGHEDVPLAQSLACFAQAIALDPSFPQPYLGLAEILRASANFGLVRPGNAGDEGWKAIQKAMSLDDSLGEAYALSGAYRAWLDFDWKGAAADFERALALSPASANAHRLRAMMLLLPLTLMEEAEREMEIAAELDPLSPLVHSLFAWLLMFKREFDQALQEVETALALKSGYALALGFRGSILYFSGRVEEGLASWLQAAPMATASPTQIGAIGVGLGLLGRQTEARELLAELNVAAESSYVPPTTRAEVFAGLG
jgi:serine/threonine-protein kinase